MEEEEENFDIDWLNERYPFDAEARNKALETEALTLLNGQDAVTLVDVGAGTGSNCLYFMDQIKPNQRWFLVEQNEDLKKATIRRFQDYASYHKYTFERRKNTLTVQSSQKKIEVNIVNGSLLELDKLVAIDQIDMVLGNAVFDLFSAAQIEQFVNLLLQFQLPFYATLNYEGMAFLPDDPFDEIFIDTYNAHMERPQDFGQALGRKAARYMTELFDAAKGKVTTAASTWQIGSDDIKMHYYLLNFMENALAEMDLPPAVNANFQSWLQRKKELIITRQQQLEIQHLDILYKVS